MKKGAPLWSQGALEGNGIPPKKQREEGPTLGSSTSATEHHVWGHS